MKKAIIVMAMLLVVGQAWAWKPKFVGHRGCNKGVMNTAEAFRNGADFYHYDGLECDVRVTSDRQYVISHDETTNAVGGNLTVASATLAQLKAENYTQTRSGVTYSGKICTVAEYLDICAEKNVFPVIELKWTTGINNNDMSNFPGLAQLIKDKGMTDKVVILTSMKSSLEYVKTHYPEFKCQFLCTTGWKGAQEWCKKWNLNPSIQVGNFDIYAVKSYVEMGMEVAAWTVNSLATYKSVGAMGVTMMTCDYLMPSEMPELADINWDDVEPVLEPLEVKCDTAYIFSRALNNLPENFPSGLDADNSPYKSAQQACVIDGVFYTNDYTTSTLVAFNESGMVDHGYATGTNSHGICTDDAGNLIQRADGLTKTPNTFVLYKKGSKTPVNVTFELRNNGQTNFISASGDVFSAEGGHIYFFPNGQKVVDIVKITDGKFEEVTSSGTLSIAGSTAGVVYPIKNDPQHFIYQVRGNGYYLYNKEDKADYVTGKSSTTVPNRNSSLGGCLFELAGHKLFAHASGSNYNGGFTIKDMSANKASILTLPVLGTGGYSANPSVGAWLKAESIDENHVWLYEYCQGNGYAKYQIYVGEPYAPQPSGVTDIATSKTVKSVRYYNLAGMESATPFSGVNIAITTYTDGTTISSKVIK
ncbi:MAG: glycerophosphodiester phosphodiesterase family protein [Sodaliphilus sp.]|nr:glycerophosphodiester phosphodiesterase family protein [Sodaliphilus sp.]